MAKTKNSFGIPYLTQGPARLIAVLNQITAALDALRVHRSVDVDSLVTPEGTLLTIRNPATIKRQTSSPPRTLLVYQVSDTEISATFGQINNTTPKIGGVSISSDPAPKLTISQTGVVFLHVTVTGGVDTTITALAIEAAATVPANTPTDGYSVLAEVDFVSGAITDVRPSGWNLFTMQKCGTSSYLFGGFGT